MGSSVGSSGVPLRNSYEYYRYNRSALLVQWGLQWQDGAQDRGADRARSGLTMGTDVATFPETFA